MISTILTGVGTASSFLLLFVYVVALFGVPVVLIALRIGEILSEKRYNHQARLRQEQDQNMDALGERRSTKKPEAIRHIITAQSMKNA